jgi:RNA polymerase sigma factor (sigma-70 family)
MATENSNLDRRAEPDRQLIARFVANGDEGAFREIVRRHGPLVMGVCRRVLGEVHDAEDAFQATFLVLARDARKIRRRNSLACWLHGVAYRIALRAAKKRTPQMAQPPEEVTAISRSALDSIVRRHDERIIDEELNKLPAADRESLTLRYLEELSNQDIAAALEISVSAVEGRLKRARSRLRHRLLLRGVSLSTFFGVVAASRLESQASETLISTTVQLSMLNASADVVGNSYPHQLAATESGEMALGVKSLLATTAAVVLATGLGFYGLLGHAVGQESNTVETVTIAGTAEPAAHPTVIIQTESATDTTANAQNNEGASDSPAPVRLEAYKKIAKALDQVLTLEFNEAPLSEVIDFLESAGDVRIDVDRQALGDVGLETNVPVTVSLNDISFRSCLARMLDNLKLDYYIANEMLVITTQEEVRKHLDPRFYKLDNLKIAPEKLIEIIQSMVAPDTWEEQGGTGKITSLGEPTNTLGAPASTLVIAQTDLVHDQIADLLEKLRAAGLTTPAYPGTEPR